MKRNSKIKNNLKKIRFPLDFIIIIIILILKEIKNKMKNNKIKNQERQGKRPQQVNPTKTS